MKTRMEHPGAAPNPRGEPGTLLRWSRDEVAAIVGDLGYSNARFGFAGEDLPKTILPGLVSSQIF